MSSLNGQNSNVGPPQIFIVRVCTYCVNLPWPVYFGITV